MAYTVQSLSVYEPVQSAYKTALTSLKKRRRVCVNCVKVRENDLRRMFHSRA